MAKHKNVPVLRFPEFSDEWEKKRLGEVAPLQRGFDLPVANIIKGIYPVVFSNGILKYHNEYKAKSPGVVTGRSGTIGKVSYVENDYWPHNTALWVTDFKNNHPKFIYYFYSKYNLERFGTGSGVPTLNRNDVHVQIESFPTFSEQQRIAAFITAVDCKITQLIQKKALIEQYKKGVMQKIFDQEVRFINDDGNNFTEWAVKKANKIFKNHSNKKHNGDLPILAITQDRGAILRDDLDMNIISSEASVKSYKIVEVGDFIISLRSFQGGIEYSNVFGICSPAYTILKPIIEINTDFYKFYLKNDSFIQELSNTVVGIRDGKQISFDAFSSLKLPYPCPSEQTKIANFLTVIDEKINQCSHQISKTEQYKKGLLQQLFV